MSRLNSADDLRQIRRVLVASTMAVGVVLALLLGYYVWQNYRDTVNEADARLLGEARALADNAEATLRAGNAVLVATQRMIEERGGISRLDERSLHDLFLRQLDLYSARGLDVPMHALFAVGADSHVRAASVEYPTKKVSTADREYFKHFSTSTSNAPLMSALNVSRLTGLQAIYLTIKIHDAQGKFDGILGISLRVKHFDQFYSGRRLKEGQTVTLYRSDGKPVYRYPMVGKFITSDLGASAGFVGMVNAKEGNQRLLSPIDGIERRIGYVLAPQYPLLALVSEPEHSVLAVWQRNSLIAGGILATVFAALIVLLRSALRNLLIASRADTANRAKGKFLAAVSHEIRTPMNGVIGLGRMLLATDLTERQRELAVNIVHSGQALLSVINDVLDYSKIDANKLEIVEENFSLADLVREVAELFRFQAQEKGVSLHIDVPDDLPAALRGDASRLRQVLINLLGNAFKFTEHGEVRLSVRCLPHAPSSFALDLAVTDTGVGISAENLGTIFEAFEQVDASSSRRHQGTGLGLAICRRLTGLMGGTISVESTSGVGSVFRVSLVLPEGVAVRIDENLVADAGVPEFAAGSDGGVGHIFHSKTRVLLVEDNRINQMVAKGVLGTLGLQDVTVL